MDKFVARKNRHVSGEAAAAYLLDPANAYVIAGKWNFSYKGIAKDRVLKEKVKEVCFRLCGSDSKEAFDAEW